MSRRLQRLLALLVSLAVVGLLVAGAGVAGAHRAPSRGAGRHHLHSVRHRRHHRHHRHHRRRRGGRIDDVQPQATPSPLGSRLSFGIYPWAAPGAVGQVAPQLADDPYAALAAVKELGGSRSITVRLYGQYTGTDAGEADALVSDATWWSDNGVRVQMVLRYRPAGPAQEAGYVSWAANVATRLAALPGMTQIQVANEANNSSSPAAGDGSYPGAIQAIAQGVPAVRAAVLAAGRTDIAVGFNWAAGSQPCRPDPLFSRLLAAGGQAFRAAVGWVGIDVYPGTWSAPAPTSDPNPSLIAASVTGSLGCLRHRQMPAAGLGAQVPITVAETGYPTDPSRSDATQVTVLRQIVGSVQSVSASDNVSGLVWFGLRDANTASGQLQNGYGLMRDDYTAKPAFQAYKQIIATDGV